MKYRSPLAFALLILAALLLPGCADTPASTPSTQPSALAPGRGECLVCKYNADLACVDIPVTATTPSALYQGKTYHFCSRQCRSEFLKDPARYVGR